MLKSLLRGFQRTHLWSGIALILLVLILRRLAGWQENEWIVVASLLCIWAVGVAIYSLFHRPANERALLILDRVGGWKDRFSSAFSFLQKASPEEGEMLHIRKSDELLPVAVKDFPKGLPLPSVKWTWLVPGLALAFSLTSLFRFPPNPQDLALTEEMQDAAALQADELNRESDKVADLDSLSDEEKKELEDLRVQVDEVASDLADAEGLTAGEMLEALEARAKAAEELADKLGLASNEWASEAMLEEMETHPDTADLAFAVRDKDAEFAAEQAFALRDLLNGNEISREIQTRMTQALEEIMAASTEDDHTKPVGERVGNAERKMLDEQPKTAAREFEELAKHFQLVVKREEASEKLENLANKLRDAGSEIGGSQLQKVEKIAANEQDGSRAGEGQGLQSIDGDPLANDLQNMTAPQYSQQPNQQGSNPMASAPNTQPIEQPAPVPGSGQKGGEDQGQGSGQMLSAPVPGETPPKEGGEGQGMAMGNESRDGDGEGGMLSAPVPGESDGESAPGSGMNMAGGASPISGSGGNQAGTGTAEMVDRETDALKASEDAKVVAQINDGGESTMKAVEGQARKEAASRSRKDIVTDFLAAEEQALNEKSLPRSRRQHVIRYFSAIREEFEKSESQ